MSTLSVAVIRDVQSFDFSNTEFAKAFDVSNAAFDQSNTAAIIANTALPNVSNAVFAGDLRVTGNLQIGTNTVTIRDNHIISAEYYRMNTANHMVVVPDGNRVNTIFTVANAAFDTANNVGPQIAPAFNKANNALANTSGVSFNGNFYVPNGSIGIGTSSSGYLLDIDQGTSDSQNIRLKNEEVSLFFGTYGTGSSYPREATINGSRADAGSLPNLRIAGQGGIKFCVDFNTERMIIDSSGRVTKPYQPMVTVTRSNHVTSSANPIVFDNIVDQTGSSYNSSTGLFTCPVAGWYYLSHCTILFNMGSGSYTWAYKNGSIYGTTSLGSYGSFTGSYAGQGGSVMVKVSAGDTLGIGFTYNGTNLHGGYTGMSIGLIC